MQPQLVEAPVSSLPVVDLPTGLQKGDGREVGEVRLRSGWPCHRFANKIQMQSKMK